MNTLFNDRPHINNKCDWEVRRETALGVLPVRRAALIHKFAAAVARLAVLEKIITATAG